MGYGQVGAKGGRFLSTRAAMTPSPSCRVETLRIQSRGPSGDVPWTTVNTGAQAGAMRLPGEEGWCAGGSEPLWGLKRHTQGDRCGLSGRVVQTAEIVCWGNENREVAPPPNRIQGQPAWERWLKTPIDQSLYVRHSSKPFMLVNTGTLPILRWRNWSSERSSHLPNPTQPTGCGPRIQTYSSAFKDETSKNVLG